MNHEFQADLDLALRLADLADTISLPRFGAADLEVLTKPDRTHVSDADLAVERALRESIGRERPEDAVFGEEYGEQGSAARQWIIDPIDGTAHFLRGVPLWGTLICLAIDGVPQVGVVTMPALGRRWWAASGTGAWTRSGADGSARPIRTSAIDQISESAASFQSITQWQGAGQLPALMRLADAVWRDRAYGDVYAYMMLAEGRLELVAEFDIKEYDIAAAVPIIREAGGRFTSFEGTDTLSAGSALASNGVLHDAFLNILHA